MSIKKSGLSYHFSLFLKEIGEGKVSQSDIKEIIDWRVDDTNPDQSLNELEQMKNNFQKLGDFILPYLYEQTQRVKRLEKKSNKVDMNTTYSVQDVMRILNVKSRKTIYNYMDDGSLEYVQLKENKRVFTQEQIDRFLNKNK